LLLKYTVIPTKDTRYAYTTGRVRALELYLLKEADFLRMRQVEKAGEVLQILIKIFPYSKSMKDIEKEEKFEKGLDRELERTYRELRYFCPEPELIDLFWLENDFYNLKVLLKIHFQKKFIAKNGLFLKPTLSQAGILNSALLEESIEKEDFAQLPSEIKILLEETFSLMENNRSPRFLDNFLSRQLFRWLVLKIRRYSDLFLSHLIQLQIDSFNIKTLFRIKFWQEKESSLREVFMEGGTVERERLFQIVSQPLEALDEEFRSTDYGEAVKKTLEEWGKEKSLFSLDKFFDEYILKHTYCGFYITLGREPLINYIFLKKQEIKRLRMILGSKSVKCKVKNAKP